MISRSAFEAVVSEPGNGKKELLVRAISPGPDELCVLLGGVTLKSKGSRCLWYTRLPYGRSSARCSHVATFPPFRQPSYASTNASAMLFKQRWPISDLHCSIRPYMLTRNSFLQCVSNMV